MEVQIEGGLVVFPEAGKERVQVWQSREEVEAAVRAGDVPVTPKEKKPLIRLEDDLDFWVGKKVGFARPGLKKFWNDLKSHIAPLSSWIARKGEDDSDELTVLRTGAGGEGTTEIQRIFGSKAFPNPKPLRLIKQLVQQAAGPDDTVVDFFAGSATTAQAVMELNKEEGGERRFIMVSSTEATNDEPDKNVCRDVTAERIRRLNAASEGKYAGLSAPFAYLRTREIAFEDMDYELSPQEVWTALETLHDLPLTPHDGEAAWQEHDGGHTLLVLVNRAEAALGERLKELAARKVNLVAYAWAPGQVIALLDESHVDVRPVRDTLVRHFRQ